MEEVARFTFRSGNADVLVSCSIPMCVDEDEELDRLRTLAAGLNRQPALDGERV